MTLTYKICKDCHESKSMGEFPTLYRFYKTTKYVYTRSSCKLCTNKSLKHWRDDNPNKSLRRTIIKPKEKSPRSNFKEFIIEPVYTYPVCEEGHRYVGTQCLPCKYGMLVNTRK